jgi:hypothetical protein
MLAGMAHEDLFLERTLRHMAAMGVPVRDTYDPAFNLDDFHSNGGYGGPRLLRIVWDDKVPFSSGGHCKKYGIPNFAAVAYDAYVIKIAERLRDDKREDVIIHECVHFLQHSTHDDEQAYVQFDPLKKNYAQYLQQRSELEAHLTQVHYIFAECPAHLDGRVTCEVEGQARSLLQKYQTTKNPAVGLQLVLLCNSHGVV